VLNANIGFPNPYSLQRDTRTTVMIVPSLPAASGQTNVYLVRVAAREFSDPLNPNVFGPTTVNYNLLMFAPYPYPTTWDVPAGWDPGWLPTIPTRYLGDVPLPPEWLQINGQTLINSGVTNADGSVWGLTVVSAPSGATVDVTPMVIHALTNNDYTFDVQVTNVTIQSLTVVSNSATQIDATNWAVVKSPTNDYVIVQATLNYTNDWIVTNAATAIQWTNGEAVPGNPLQRMVTKSNSVETTVTASLGSTTTNLNVWVIWSKVTIQTSGTNTSPMSLMNISGNDGTEILGIRYFTTTFPNDSVAGKICGIATITPAGIHSIITNGWDFFQKKATETFVDGTIYSGWSFPPWTPDGPYYVNDTKTVVPDSNDKLYTLDTPSIVTGGFSATNSIEMYKNFYDYITWSNQICCDTNVFWHFQGTWTNQTPQFNSLDVGTGTITLP